MNLPNELNVICPSAPIKNVPRVMPVFLATKKKPSTVPVDRLTRIGDVGIVLSQEHPSYLFKFGPCEKVKRDTYQVHILNDNLLIQTSFEDRQKFQSCLNNFFRPGLVTSRVKFQKDLLNMNFSKGCLKMMSIPNAGGSSLISEVISFEFLKNFCNAELCKTEMEIEYFPHGSKITDYSVMIDGEIYGVSVTRAFDFRGSMFYTEKAAHHLLTKKLNGIYWSSKNVVKEHKWKKQILHTFCPDRDSAEVVKKAYRGLKNRGNSILLITVCGNPLVFKERANFRFK